MKICCMNVLIRTKISGRKGNNEKAARFNDPTAFFFIINQNQRLRSAFDPSSATKR